MGNMDKWEFPFEVAEVIKAAEQQRDGHQAAMEEHDVLWEAQPAGAGKDDLHRRIDEHQAARNRMETLLIGLRRLDPEFEGLLLTIDDVAALGITR